MLGDRVRLTKALLLTCEVRAGWCSAFQLLCLNSAVRLADERNGEHRHGISNDKSASVYKSSPLDVKPAIVRHADYTFRVTRRAFMRTSEERLWSLSTCAEQSIAT